MVRTIEIKTLADVNKILFNQERSPETGRFRSSYLYRGMRDETFDLSTSLQRNCADKADLLEKPMLENFIKYVSIEDPTIDDSIWKAMVVGQHHGLPTRLLDWSISPLVALHFAQNERYLRNMDRNNSVVWGIDAKELNTLLSQKYKDSLEKNKTFIFSVKMLSELTNSIEEYDRDMGGSAFITIEPPSIDQRIVNQYSYFSIIPAGITDVEKFLDENTNNTKKFIIDHSIRWDLRDILDQMNMNERTVYPGIDGIAAWLARHYYVKR